MSRSRRWFPSGGIDGMVVGLPLLALYLRTMSIDIGTVDSGELAVVCARLGIAHPTGYPLYTMLGRLACAALPFQPIVAVNLLSAVLAVAAAVVVAQLTREFLMQDAAGAPRGQFLQQFLLPWSAGLWFGTDAVFWDQATGNEVYGGHLLLVALLLRQGTRLLDPKAGPREVLLAAWIAGLAFAHHLSVIFLAPAFFFVVASFVFKDRPPRRAAGERRARAGLLLPAAGLLLLAWSAVLFLPLRSRLDPVLDWGDPTSWARFWRHVQGSQYRVWMFESRAQWGQNLGNYVASLPGRLSWPLLALIPLGIWRTARASRQHAAFLGVVVLTVLIWASSYDIHDLEPYYLPADLGFVLLAAAGGLDLAAKLRPGGVARRILPACALGLFVLVQAGSHFRACDRRHDHFIRFHIESVLRSLPSNTVLLTRFWDAVNSPSLYVQEIERERTDVTVVDTELLRRSWYYAQIRRRDSSLLVPLEDRVREFQIRVAPFEAGRHYEAGPIEASYRSVLAGIAQSHRPQRATAWTADVEPGFSGSAVGVPEGLVYVLRDAPEEARPVDPPDVEGLLRSGYRPENRIHRMVIQEWMQAIAARVRFLDTMGRTEEIPPWQAAQQRLLPVMEDARRRGL